ncbi:MAG: hypothetical protein HY917_03080 [Candidatus Diapherotrites archaeon]|nr:hypothetical protein [Candidatus Diapherotrites archaeon]
MKSVRPHRAVSPESERRNRIKKRLIGQRALQKKGNLLAGFYATGTWAIENSPMRVIPQVSRFLEHYRGKQPLQILSFGGHPREIGDLKELLHQHGFRTDSNSPRQAVIHQTLLKNESKKRVERVPFHAVSTDELDEYFLKKKPPMRFGLVVAQNSFFTGNMSTDALLRLYRILEPDGQAILHYNSKSFTSPGLLKEVKDLTKHFETNLISTPSGDTTLVLTRRVFRK